MRNQTLQIKNKKGFTLIEVMIAVGLFTVVMVVGIGAVLNVNTAYKKTQKMRALIDNMGFVMEDMTKSIRTGTLYHCPTVLPDITFTSSSLSPFDATNCIGQMLSIAFQPASSLNTTLSQNQYAYVIVSGVVYKLTSDGSPPVQISPSEITIDGGKSGFVVAGNDPTSPEQPRVMIRLEGKITYRGNDTPFELQTTVVSRMPKTFNSNP